MDHFVEFEDVCKYYQTGSVKIAAADHMNFYVDKGEFCIIVGPSGAGKTTLLNILGGMDSCDEGHVWLDGRKRLLPPTAGTTWALCSSSTTWCRT